MPTFRVTIEVHDISSQSTAEEWAAAVISVSCPKCVCTHNGKHEPWGACSVCRGSGIGPHPYKPQVLPARSVR